MITQDIVAKMSEMIHVSHQDHLFSSELEECIQVSIPTIEIDTLLSTAPTEHLSDDMKLWFSMRYRDNLDSSK
mgnify:CR=1 FL=1